MKYFLAKTEPGTFSIQDFEAESETLWDGVHSYEAMNNIKLMSPGDVVFIYHSNVGKNIVGEAVVSGEPFLNTADPRRSWAVKMKFVRAFDGPTLAECKASSECTGFKLVTHSRLSVCEVPDRAVAWITSKA